jgi:predicted metal-dependent phosphoesterase TrpH
LPGPSLPRLIDLHTHTDESDGTVAPARLVEMARSIGLEALGICDHDTLAGYDQAVAPAREAGLELVCGIELSTKRRRRPEERGQPVHVLGYFLDTPPSAEFRAWLERLQESRRDRNRRLAARLQSLGLDIRLEEVIRMGRSLAGRPHFARLMLEKGYVSTIQQAFERYLGESAQAYVEREEPDLKDGIRRIADAGGLPSLAHPVRLSKRPQILERLVAEMHDLGLRAIEVWHSEHGPCDVELYLALARRHGITVTGGTDFHGDTKPGVALGTGYGNVAVTREVLDNLRTLSTRR